ncbi:glucokinase [Xylanibacter ruminicola]|jgi:glucokinase|uniref:Glucokinase n=1 Tax=Xylanibacter ruminicola TaxID=839 RepID=A0A1H5S426_XYLRU|nr:MULTISPECIES: ROK family protein [Prevotellaceae]MCR5469969.1 ROK family protein [Prevotella sp.]SEF44577.1 glucokinase [Xylanibacter ruminicola]SEW12405.1 glucokinase [Prevotella sp. khp7]
MDNNPLVDTVDKIKTRVVGVDIRLERTTFAVVDIRGDIVAQDYFDTRDYGDINDFATVLCEKIIMLVEENGGIETVRSVGVSAPSASAISNCIENAANLPWKGVIPLGAMLRDRLGLAVAVANDAHITALSEKSYGSAHGMKDFVIVSLSHGGLGSCFYSNGQPHLGCDGFAGEVGHTCVVLNGRQCGCGNKGCLETYCSKAGLVRTAEELLAESKEPSLLSELPDMNVLSIAQCCDKGDKVAIEAYRFTGDMLGLGLANYASVLNPEAIILTGDMVQAGKWLLKPMRASFERHVFRNIKNKTRILVSILKEGERDVLGASALAWDVKEYSLFK